MKKILSFMLALTFVFALTACGEKDSVSSIMQEGSDMMSETKDNVSSFIGGVESGVASMVSRITQSNATISAEEARDIALKDAGVTKDNIHELESELDRELGILVYDIEFKSGDKEYSYEINAESGAIIDRHTKKDYD